MALAAACALLPGAARADTITVTSMADDGGPGTLRSAIADAPAGSTIVVPAGTITLQSGELDIGEDLTITGAGAGATAISGGLASRVFAVSGSGVDLTLSQLTVRDGLVVSTIAQGAGLFVGSGASVTLGHVAFTNNVADADATVSTNGGLAEGGAIHSVGALTIEDSSFTGNAAFARAVSGNNAGNGEGGAIFAVGALSMARSVISGNKAVATGGAGGKTGLADGGGIDVFGGPTTITDSTVSGNLADASIGSGGVTNAATEADGGGINVDLPSGATGLISNTTVTGNTVKADLASGSKPALGGGLVLLANSAATLTLQNSTVADNTGLNGGNISVPGPVIPKVVSTIVSSGHGVPGQENCSASMTSLGHNIESLNQCGLGAAGDQPNTDPRLGPLQDNGGPVQTLAIGVGSPAFNSGDAATCPATDARGIARPQGAACDVGAFELELADLGLRAAASSPRVKIGSLVTFTLSASNGGSGTGHATAITGALQNGLTFVSASPSAGACAGTRNFSCGLGDFAPGAPGGVQIVARATRPGVHALGASIASSTVDLAGGNNNTGASVTVGKLGVSAARMSPRSFRLGTRTTIRFTLPEAAHMKLSFARRSGRRFRSAGSIGVRGHAGVNKLRFNGRLTRRKTLRPGRYRLTLRATDRFGNHSAAKKLTFRLLPHA